MKYIIVINVDHCLRKRKKKKKQITILITETKSGEHIYKRDIINQLTTIFKKYYLKKYVDVLIEHGSKKYAN